MNHKKRFAIIFTIAFLLLAFQNVFAHPLGNFSTNRYSRLLVYPDQIHITYIVDMAEIPTFQERQQMDLNKDEQISQEETAAYLQTRSPLLADKLKLRVNQSPVELAVQHEEMFFSSGQGGLPTLRLKMSLQANLPTGLNNPQIFYADQNFAGRLGWQEIIVQPTDAIRLLSSSVPAEDMSSELQDYPDDGLQNPPAVSQAEFTFETAVFSPTLPQKGQTVLTTSSAEPAGGEDKFASLLTTTLNRPEAVFLALLIAFGLGAAHALTPGHGKTIVGAYLVGSRGSAKHALFLGLITTITHTAGVFIFGLIIFFASQFILPAQLYPWLGVFSGLLVILIGFSLTRNHIRSLRKKPTSNHEEVEGYHTHFGIGHTHTPPSAPGWRSLLGLGISGGLLPCPSALILLLSAVALQKVGLGLVLIVAFSVGLAAVLTGIGLALVYAGQLFNKFSVRPKSAMSLLPVASAIFITIAGTVITVQAFMDTGLLTL